MSDDHSNPGNGPAENSEELIAGRHAVLEALRFGKPLRILLAEGQKGAVIDEITLLSGQRKVPVQRMSREAFLKKAGDISGNQGVAAIVPSFQYYDLDELIAISRTPQGQPFLIMLDHLEDPHNLGAVMRTADAAGVHGLIIPNHRAAGVTAAVRKVASGAAERMPVAMVTNLSQAAVTLKKEGFWLYGAEGDSDEEYYRADYLRPLVLVLGSEGKGLSRLLRQNCDLIVSIPMPGAAAGSLNVSAAAAVLIYNALAKRKGWIS